MAPVELKMKKGSGGVGGLVSRNRQRNLQAIVATQKVYRILSLRWA